MHTDQQVGPNYHLAMPDFADNRGRNCERARQFYIFFNVEVLADRSQQWVRIVGSEVRKSWLLYDFLVGSIGGTHKVAHPHTSTGRLYRQ